MENIDRRGRAAGSWPQPRPLFSRRCWHPADSSPGRITAPGPTAAVPAEHRDGCRSRRRAPRRRHRHRRRTPTPTPTPGKGPGCAAARCTSVLVTGDMLVHPQLWQQAREDARAAGAAGLDFGPLLEGQRRYIEQSDVAICHLETPGGRTRTDPSLGYPFLQRSAADHHRRAAAWAIRPARPPATTPLTAAPRG